METTSGRWVISAQQYLSPRADLFQVIWQEENWSLRVQEHAVDQVRMTKVIVCSILGNFLIVVRSVSESSTRKTANRFQAEK